MASACRGAAAATALLMLLPRLAGASVDCSNPDNLCTGDPCVIPSLEVASPCIVDFTPRALIIAGTVETPIGGVLSLSAADVTVSGAVDASYGSDVSLTAGDDLSVAGAMLARESNGVSMTLTAGADLTLTSTGTVRLLSPFELSGNGQLYLAAGGNIDLAGNIRLVQSSNGHPILSADAGGVLTVSRRISAEGCSITLAGAQGVTVQAPIRGANRAGLSDNVQITSAAGPVLIHAPIHVPARPGSLDTGGTLVVEAAGDILIDAVIRARGRSTGGIVTLASTGGDVTLNERVQVAHAGNVFVEADGVATLNHLVSIGGNPGSGRGKLRVEASAITASPRARVRGNSLHRGSELCFRATGGNLLLSGRFLARGPHLTPVDGNIEAEAAGNLTADGIFRCAPDGCIAFTAGGTLDTSGGSFDKPIESDCPLDCAGSPSAAFVASTAAVVD